MQSDNPGKPGTNAADVSRAPQSRHFRGEGEEAGDSVRAGGRGPGGGHEQEQMSAVGVGRCAAGSSRGAWHPALPWAPQSSVADPTEGEASPSLLHLLESAHPGLCPLPRAHSS